MLIKQTKQNTKLTVSPSQEDTTTTNQNNTIHTKLIK